MSNSPSDPIRLSVPRPADRKKKLGKGLGALMGETQREEPLVRQPAGKDVTSGADAPEGSRLVAIPIGQIEPLPGQPRSYFDEAALAELAASISARGVIQPIIVRPKGEGRYQLVAGERRWRAAQKARIHEIPAIVRDLDEREVVALALIENLQREDLNPVEEARAYHQLSEDEGMTQAEIAKLVDKSRSHVANFQRLLALPEEVLDLLGSGALTMGHARALIGNDRAAELARSAARDGLSVREIEKLARGDAPKRKPPRRGAVREATNDADIAAVQGHLEDFLGMPVRIKTDSAPNNGTVSIRYRTLDQLDLICQRLTGGDI
ncbi:ParB/RepB/Spo0J family partition protein [Qipengyuania marisflavi]|uniref:ParB/RepB/Spo0J family partition protein n=1 Tax=Qipengyuania marisflavi TaxID=2486356 RepID=A0A5S3P5J5_9SPHN|nr:ParB/RepB/Spo0J family partition protein [Qipengyuania marisflavi]TMM48196.1 ParB/RepB/Spo0J family partition protein [Qipengyuania marisflavi]